jgi:hypothetical protein
MTIKTGSPTGTNNVGDETTALLTFNVRVPTLPPVMSLKMNELAPA